MKKLFLAAALFLTACAGKPAAKEEPAMKPLAAGTPDKAEPVIRFTAQLTAEIGGSAFTSAPYVFEKPGVDLTARLSEARPGQAGLLLAARPVSVPGQVLVQNTLAVPVTVLLWKGRGPFARARLGVGDTVRLPLEESAAGNAELARVADTFRFLQSQAARDLLARTWDLGTYWEHRREPCRAGEILEKDSCAQLAGWIARDLGEAHRTLQRYAHKEIEASPTDTEILEKLTPATEQLWKTASEDLAGYKR